MNSYSEIDQKFMIAFMLTFRSFTTSNELLDLLIARFCLNPPSGADTESFSKTLKVIRLRYIIHFFLMTHINLFTEF